MKNLKINRGTFKGKAIPEPAAVKGHAHFTPGLLKEAVFQHIENTLGFSGTAFYDFFAGSGQMAYEAYSLGMEPVHLFEVDRRRFADVLSFTGAKKWNIQLHRRDFRRTLAFLVSDRAVLFFDPPFSFWERFRCPALEEFIEKCAETFQKRSSTEMKWLLIIQGPEALQIEEFEKQTDIRKYRGQYLTIISLDQNC